MKTLEQARAIQRALDSVFEPVRLPVPDAFEDDSDGAWAEWDRAVAQQEKQQ